MLHPKYGANKELVGRFIAEARLVNQIRHPNIVEITDFIEDHTGFYGVMEFLRGEDMADAIAKGAMPVTRALPIAIQIAGAIAAAHRLGVIHRDLKPGNVFLTEVDGREIAKVLDFGIAKFNRDRMAEMSGTASLPAATSTGFVLGSPRYMSPEQALGDEIDEASDIFAFGVLMYEAIKGVEPFRAKSLGELAVQHLKRENFEPLVRTRGVNPLLDRIADLLDRCLRYRPEDRPASMEDVLNELRAIERGLPSPHQEQRRSITGIVVAAVLVAVGAWGAVWYQKAQRPEPVVAATEPPAAPPIPAPPAAPEPIPAPPQQVEVAIRSVPEGAAVRRVRTNTLLGETPIATTLARSAEREAFEFTKAGYVSLIREASLAENLVFEVTLQKRRRGKQPEPQAKPAPRPEPEAKGGFDTDLRDPW
jgi:serine/threonine-protein kinase